MKIILIVDDKKLGKKDSVVEVADSYANNVLIPKKIAVQATKDNLNKLVQRQEKTRAEHEKAWQQAIEAREQLNELKTLIIAATGATSGKLFGAITNKDIAVALAERNIVVDKHNISLSEPIKACGEYIVNIKLFEDITAALKVSVVNK